METRAISGGGPPPCGGPLAARSARPAPLHHACTDPLLLEGARRTKALPDAGPGPVPFSRYLEELNRESRIDPARGPLPFPEYLEGVNRAATEAEPTHEARRSDEPADDDAGATDAPARNAAHGRPDSPSQSAGPDQEPTRPLRPAAPPAPLVPVLTGRVLDVFA